MKSTIGIYKTQGEALRAVQELKTNGFTDKQISVIGHTKGTGTAEDELESQDPEHEMDKSMKVAATTVGIGAVLGPILGALAGVGILAIPGVGFLSFLSAAVLFLHWPLQVSIKHMKRNTRNT